MVDVLGDHLANAAGGYEPQRQNHWIVQLGLPGRDDEIIQFSAESSALPTVSVEEVELNYINIRRYAAGRAVYEVIPLVLKDMVDRGTADAMERWHERVYNPLTDQVGLAAGYKQEAQLILFGPNGSLERTWRLIGCWPLSVAYGALDYGSSDKVLIETQLRYDKALPEGLAGGVLSSLSGVGTINL
jgi:hypothetical protein